MTISGRVQSTERMMHGHITELRFVTQIRLCNKVQSVIAGSEAQGKNHIQGPGNWT